MKQLLLVAMIHLLILHQHRKDKAEVLAPKKSSTEKVTRSYNYDHYYWLMGINVTANDSARITYQAYPYPPGFYSSLYSLIQR